MKLVDWRDAPESDVEALYSAETIRWRDSLGWDTTPSWEIVEAGRRAGHVPGWIAREADGSVSGWTFYILHDLTLQIGGLVARRPAAARALLDAALTGPEALMARSLSCFIFPDCRGISSALARQRFTVRDALYLTKSLSPGREAGEALAQRMARPWTSLDLVGAVRLLAAAYEGVPGAACFAPGGRREEWARYVAQLVHTPAVGQFDPAMSFCVPLPGPEDLTRIGGVVLTTRLSPATAHIAQIAVDPLHRRLGIGERLLGAASDAALAAGASDLTLMVDEANTPARTFYAAAGFKETARFLYGRRGARTRLAA